MVIGPSFSKRVALAVLTILLLCILPIGIFAAPQSENIVMSVKAGYEDAARVGASAPFKITLLNKGDDVSGELQVAVFNGPESKVVFAVPFELPKGANKEIPMNIPVYTANRKVEIKLVRNGKILKSVEYEFKKLFAPNTPVIGVLSDDSGAFRDLNGIKLSEINSAVAVDMMARTKLAIASGDKVISADIPAELILLDESNISEDIKVLNSFDMLIISNFDTSSLTEKQVDAVEKWVNAGKMLFIGTGSNWKKVYNGLKPGLKPFGIDGSKTISSLNAIETFTGKSIPKAQTGLYVATGKLGEGTAIMEDSGTPLVALYKTGEGVIGVLAFDPTMSPFSGWEGTQALWQKLYSEAGKQRVKTPSAQPGQYYNPRQQLMNIQHLASSVPENQTPPYTFLIIMIGIYVLIAGPVLYLLLKWKDKRDWNWVVIPAAALVFMSIIYVAGLKTRYTEAVMNNISLIKLDSSLQKAKVNTIVGAFNNQRGNMKVSYDKNLTLETNTGTYYDPHMSISPNRDNRNIRLISKYTFAEPPSYEFYDTRMWDVKYLTANNDLPLKGGVDNKVSISNGVLKGTITNTTDYDLKESFISFGSIFVDTGDIPRGKSVEINIPLSGGASFSKLGDFLDARYGSQNRMPGQKLPPDQPLKNRKRELVSNCYQAAAFEAGGEASILFFAFNYDDPGYGIVVNGKQPKVYNTNMIYSITNMNFERGTRAEIPSGIVKPVVETGNVGYYQEQYDSGMRITSDGNADFKFTVPGNLNVDHFKLKWSTVIPTYMKYQSQQPGAPQMVYAKNEYKFYIYNYSKSDWDKIDKEFESNSGMSTYINSKGEIRTRVNAVMDKNGMQGEMLEAPELEISGVVR